MMGLLQKVDLPEAKLGDWAISRFEIDKMGAAISLFSYGARAPRPGIYTKLTQGHTLWMTDTDAELYDHVEPVYQAKGHCLINGLGIGAVLAACLRKEAVKKVTVIEIAQPVIDLVGPHYRDPRVELVCADAFTYQPPKGVRYGMVWHDIWPTICADNLPEMHRLHRKYGKRCDWQGSWARYECERRT